MYQFRTIFLLPAQEINDWKRNSQIANIARWLRDSWLQATSSNAYIGVVQQVPNYHPITVQWRHNKRDGRLKSPASRLFPNRIFRRRSKKTSKLRVTGLCAGNSPVTGEFNTSVSATKWAWREYKCLELPIVKDILMLQLPTSLSENWYLFLMIMKLQGGMENCQHYQNNYEGAYSKIILSKHVYIGYHSVMIHCLTYWTLDIPAALGRVLQTMLLTSVIDKNKVQPTWKELCPAKYRGSLAAFKDSPKQNCLFYKTTFS